ncbi:MAG: helix-turn-helix transcriptional regulator [Marmoricola sp.]
MLESLLVTRMVTGPAPSPQVAWAWRAMRHAAGAVRVADLVAAAGCSHRHLIAGFRDQIGTTPKTAAQVLRYQHAAQLLNRGDLTPATVATICGYADQSHLTREFTRFCRHHPRRVAAIPHLIRQRATAGPTRSTFFKTAQSYRSTMTHTQRIIPILV